MQKRYVVTWFFWFWCTNLLAQQAFISVPVAEMLGQSMKSIISAQTKKYHVSTSDILKRYETIPAISEKNDLTCPRIYQLLFNERVEVLEEQGPEVKISVPYALYGQGPQTSLSGIYWTLKKNILTCDQVGKKIFEQAVPEIFNGLNQHQKTVVLKQPWYNRVTKKTYSAGTRFIIHHVTSKKNYAVLIYDPLLQKTVITSIPRSLALMTPRTPEQAERQYIALIKEWARASAKNTISYVWGGASLMPSSVPGAYGFDCAGFIIRAAQSCSIPFYLKNSSAQMRYLDELGNKHLKNGDIIWIPGHVMVVGDSENNRIIESRGYASGYGKLHELPVQEVFKNISTFADLEKAYRNQQPLQLLNDQGEVSLQVPTYKILQFSSVWHNHTKHTPMHL